MQMGIQSQPLAPLAVILLKRLHYKCFSSFRQVKKVVYLRQRLSFAIKGKENGVRKCTNMFYLTWTER